MALIDLEPELRDPIPRPMRWSLLSYHTGARAAHIETVLRTWPATRGSIWQCEWWDDGRADERGASIRAVYRYVDAYGRTFVRRFERSYDDLHVALSGYGAIRARTWRPGGSVTVLYDPADPGSHFLYDEIFERIISPAPPRSICPCCGLQTLNAIAFAPCPTCGQHTLAAAPADAVCRVCGWVVGTADGERLDAARAHYRLLGACDPTSLVQGQVQPYPDEIVGFRCHPPRLWLTGFEPGTSVQTIASALIGISAHLANQGQILIARQPIAAARSADTLVQDRLDTGPGWYAPYNPKAISFVGWRDALTAALARLDIAAANAAHLCAALFSETNPTLTILDPILLNLYDPTATWSHWSLLIDRQMIIEVRVGTAKAH